MHSDLKPLTKILCLLNYCQYFSCSELLSAILRMYTMPVLLIPFPDLWSSEKNVILISSWLKLRASPLIQDTNHSNIVIQVFHPLIARRTNSQLIFISSFISSSFLKNKEFVPTQILSSQIAVRNRFDQEVWKMPTQSRLRSEGPAGI